MRGLYKCVKYDAEDKVNGEKGNNKAILVIGGSLCPENQKVNDTLEITVIETINPSK